MISKEFVDIIIYNEKEEYLLQHRTSDAPKDPNKYDLFGGGVETGESPAQALARELWEELELKIDNPRFYLKTETVEDGINKIRYYYEACINTSSEELRKNQHEGQGLDFFSPEELEKIDLRFHQIEPLKSFISQKQKKN